MAKTSNTFEHSLSYILRTFSASASNENIKTNHFELEGHNNKKHLVLEILVYIRAQVWIFWFQYVGDMGGDKALNLLILLTLKCSQHLVYYLRVPHEHQICCNAFLCWCLCILILLYQGTSHLVTTNRNLKCFRMNPDHTVFHFKLKY